MTTFFQQIAHDQVQKSYVALENKNYLSSWARTIPARMAFVADAIVDAVVLPFTLIGAAFGVLLYLFSWGEETALLGGSIYRFDELANRLVSSTIGAVISTGLGDTLHDKKPFEWLLLIGTIGYISMKIFPCMRWPNMFIIGNHGWSLGWIGH